MSVTISEGPQPPAGQRGDKVLLTEISRTSTFMKPLEEAELEIDSDSDTDLEDAYYEMKSNEGRDEAPLINKDSHAELLYRQKCRDLGVVPISYFLRHMEDEELSLRCQHFGPVGAQALAAPLMVNTFIRKLDLSYNGVGDSGVKAIIQTMMENLYITDLDLSDNSITSTGAKCLCSLLLSNPQIAHLNMSGNPLGDKSAKYFAAVLEHNRVLSGLYLSACDFGQEAGEQLGPAIGSNETLNTLDLSWNHIRLKGAVAVAKGLKENVRLHTVNLGWNGLSMEGAKVMKEALAENSTLEELDIQCNRLMNEAVILLSKGLEKNDGLRVLKVGHNPFNDAGAFSLIKAVQTNENSTIEYLDLKGVLVKDDFFEVLKELKDTKKLEAVYEEFNPSIKYREKSDLVPPGKAATDNLLRYIEEKNTDVTAVFSDAIKQTGDMAIAENVFLKTIKDIGFRLPNRQLEHLCDHLASTEEKGLVDLSLLIQMEKDNKEANTKDNT